MAFVMKEGGFIVNCYLSPKLLIPINSFPKIYKIKAPYL